MKRYIRFLLPPLVWCLLAGCGKPSQENAASWGDTRPVGSMELT